MDPIIEKQYIASLILKEKLGIISEIERQELKQWLQESPDHQDIYVHLCGKNLSKELRRYRHIDAFQGLKNYRNRYSQKKKIWYTRWYWSAAIAILLVGISLLFLGREGKMDGNKLEIVSGNAKAVLVLNNGEVIDLSEKNKSEIIVTEELSVRNTGKQLSYTVATVAGQEPKEEYNELVIPRGGEFVLVLADGTKVWLNSQTKIKYPVAFNVTVRKVFLEGEAYFEVVKNLECPFHVCMKNGVDVEVLGTSFNVRAYSDENIVETVLEEGKVKMSKDGETVILDPGVKAKYLSGGTIQVDEVDTELYTAWRTGQYIFMNEKVENILKHLERWYNIEVFYKSEKVKSILFSGDVKKYDDINILLDAMEAAGGVYFERCGRTLIVSGD